ncbi:MAG: hypothetical protein LQ350_005542 [Teloschistes chrysophthalmus]|nr:MAG: hypothetical protein LQ350_005542 [Niorma chrysophthalma]
MTETVTPSLSTDRPLPNGDSASPSLRSLCTSLHQEITAFLQEDFSKETTLQAVQEQTRKSLTIIQAALDRYPLRTLSLSYNGGKDCLVLLILYLSLLSTHPDLPDRLPAIYIPPSHPFASVTDFTLRSAARYHLNLDLYSDESSSSSQFTTTSTSTTPKGQDDAGREGRGGKGKGGGSMKEAFTQYLSRNPDVDAIFVGTRRTDPHGGKLSPEGFDMTDGGWPRFMRVHPVIEWHYREIWALYDQGYTSLGGTNDTHPNPALRVAVREGEGGGDGTGGEERYRPAYELEEDGEERLGRDW